MEINKVPMTPLYSGKTTVRQIIEEDHHNSEVDDNEEVDLDPPL